MIFVDAVVGVIKVAHKGGSAFQLAFAASDTLTKKQAEPAGSHGNENERTYANPVHNELSVETE